MNTRVILGCDPGVHGGLVVIHVADDIATLIAAVDIPTVGTGAGERVDVLAVRDWIVRHKPTAAFIERSQAMPRQGSSSGFKYGRATGSLEAAVILCEVPIEIVDPAKWKRFFRLPGKDKERARQRALELFPAAHAMLARKKDHGRADAALIALYGARKAEAPVLYAREVAA